MTRFASCLFCVPMCVIVVKIFLRHFCGMSDDAHFRLRIPRSIKDWVEERAKANNRSINAEILSCLELVRTGNVLDESAAKERLEVLVDEAIKPVTDKLETDFANMMQSLDQLMRSVKKD
ncbi:Arc-like DNA binding domain protein [Gluconobacter japonicus]|nr:Arc-like DNA binding domain protein [Gluconobacter japonicus]